MRQAAATAPSTEKAVALAIAGYDPSSGAGVTADLLVFAAHGLFATTAITALTVQSTMGVRRAEPVTPGLLAETLDCLEGDLPPDGIKIGMLGTAEHVMVVAQYVARVRTRRRLQVVLDPVLRSSSGAMLLDNKGRAALQKALIPLADAITPNLQEAELLTGLSCRTRPEMERAASKISLEHPKLTVVITGGHLPDPADLLWWQGEAHWFAGDHISTQATHGTGCAFSSALLAQRMLGHDWVDSVRNAKQYVRQAMQRAIPRGSGKGPLHLFDPAPRSSGETEHR